MRATLLAIAISLAAGSGILAADATIHAPGNTGDHRKHCGVDTFDSSGVAFWPKGDGYFFNLADQYFIEVFKPDCSLVTVTNNFDCSGYAGADHEGITTVSPDSDVIIVQSENGAGVCTVDADDVVNGGAVTVLQNFDWPANDADCGNGYPGVGLTGSEGVAFVPDSSLAGVCRYSGYLLATEQTGGFIYKYCIHPTAATLDCMARYAHPTCNTSNEISGLDYDYESRLLYIQSDNGNATCVVSPPSYGVVLQTILDPVTGRGGTINTFEGMAFGAGKFAYSDDGTGASPGDPGDPYNGLWLFDDRWNTLFVPEASTVYVGKTDGCSHMTGVTCSTAANCGTTFTAGVAATNPCCEIQGAHDSSATVAGTTIEVHAGTYNTTGGTKAAGNWYTNGICQGGSGDGQSCSWQNDTESVKGGPRCPAPGVCGQGAALKVVKAIAAVRNAATETYTMDLQNKRQMGIWVNVDGVTIDGARCTNNAAIEDQQRLGCVTFACGSGIGDCANAVLKNSTAVVAQPTTYGPVCLGGANGGSQCGVATQATDCPGSTCGLADISDCTSCNVGFRIQMSGLSEVASNTVSGSFSTGMISMESGGSLTTKNVHHNTFTGTRLAGAQTCIIEEHEHAGSVYLAHDNKCTVTNVGSASRFAYPRDNDATSYYWNNWATGPQYAFYCQDNDGPNAENVFIFGNTMEDCGEGARLLGGDSYRAHISNNIFKCGIMVRFDNCTGSDGTGACSLGGSGDAYIKNNAYSLTEKTGTGTQIPTSGNIHSDCALDAVTHYLTGASTPCIDVGFNNPAASGVDTCSASGTPCRADVVGTVRPQGLGFDLGFFESLGGSDTTPPATITDLAFDRRTPYGIAFRFTAPGDDGAGGGSAATYDMRYTQAATCAGFDYATATPVTGWAVPLPPGQTEELRWVAGLAANTPYCFSMKTLDSTPNASAASTPMLMSTSLLNPPFPPAKGTLRRGGTPGNQLWSLTGSANGTSTERPITLVRPASFGTAQLAVDGELEGSTVTISLRESRFAAGEADLFSATGTITAGHFAVNKSAVDNIYQRNRLSLPPGTYILKITSSSANSRGIVSGEIGTTRR